MKILIASNNKHKIIEFQAIFRTFDNIKLLTPKDLNIEIEIEENGTTFEENSIIKAKKYFEISKIPTIADDSGLIVPDLNNEPGIYSARYAGIGSTDNLNRQKLLENIKLKGLIEPKAKFICIICFYDGNNEYIFNGECQGKIIDNERGNNGFGYDPIFVPDGFSLTFAELDSEIKNKISHRAKALEKFKFFMNEYLKK